MKGLLIFGIFILICSNVNGKIEWWQTMSLYQIYPRSFKDSNGDGIGDLKGIESKLEHLVDSKVDAFWLSPMYPSPMLDFGYDISDFRGIDPVYGSMQDFEDLLNRAHELSLKVVLDFVPNHSSDKHEWFQKSVKKIEPYTDYYVWHEGKFVNGERQPPNNWISVFYGSAWTWNEDRQAYYYHQFLKEQPDLNFRNEHVVEEMKDIMRFWMDKGVDGFRIDAVPHFVEDKDFRDEPLSGKTNNSMSYGYLNHIYTNALPETYELVHQWRDVIDEYENTSNSRVIMMEAYADDIRKVMDYFSYGASFPFNFAFTNSVNRNFSAEKIKKIVDTWMDNLPSDGTSNWVAGNHDNSRLATRFGRELALAVQAMVQLLPGVAVTYNGEEIGMEDMWLSWEDTQDPQGCNAGREEYDKVSRDPGRTPFQWDATLSAGFSTNPKTWLPVNSNYESLNLDMQKTSDDSYYKNFLKITNLRKWPAVVNGSLQTKLLNDNIFAFSRELNDEKSIYVVVNFGYQPETVNLNAFENAPSKVQFYLSTSDIPNGRNGDAVDSESLQVGPGSGSIFTSLD